MKSKGTYILDGKTPVVCEDYQEWAIWLGTTDRTVDLTRVANVEISTVCIGIDLSDTKPPRLFETILSMFEDAQMDPQVADAMKRQFANRIERACTWDEAQLMHNECIDRVKKALAAAEKNLSRKDERDNGSDDLQP
jgi:hypothetical protein